MTNYVQHPDPLYRTILVPDDATRVMSHDDHQVYVKTQHGWLITFLYVSKRLSFEEYTSKYCLKKFINGEWVYVYEQETLLNRQKVQM